MLQDRLARAIGYEFHDQSLLRTALTHRSFGTPNYERLEFLGDSVLSCVIAADLYHRFPQLPEGDLSRVRAIIVKQQSLYEHAQRLGIGESLLLGEGEVKSGGRARPSILADALEAIIGAIYLDGGFAAARTVIKNIFEPLLAIADPAVLGKDPKTLLQELLQGRRMPLPQYSVIAVDGEAHQQRFKVECAVPQLNIRVTGEGLNRRAAEQNAAELVYRQLIAGS
jgi:ribonuclease-3